MHMEVYSAYAYYVRWKHKSETLGYKDKVAAAT